MAPPNTLLDATLSFATTEPESREILPESGPAIPPPLGHRERTIAPRAQSLASLLLSLFARLLRFSVRPKSRAGRITRSTITLAMLGIPAITAFAAFTVQRAGAGQSRAMPRAAYSAPGNDAAPTLGAVMIRLSNDLPRDVRILWAARDKYGVVRIALKVTDPDVMRERLVASAGRSIFHDESQRITEDGQIEVVYRINAP